MAQVDAWAAPGQSRDLAQAADAPQIPDLAEASDLPQVARHRHVQLLVLDLMGKSASPVRHHDGACGNGILRSGTVMIAI
ncbi:hypothetical protein GCM10010349_35610 [Streptomyces flavofungini]|nr:hypothetical protein GCM10010349_35610 [Streptomyces flavofungini]